MKAVLALFALVSVAYGIPNLHQFARVEDAIKIVHVPAPYPVKVPVPVENPVPYSVPIAKPVPVPVPIVKRVHKTIATPVIAKVSHGHGYGGDLGYGGLGGYGGYGGLGYGGLGGYGGYGDGLGYGYGH